MKVPMIFHVPFAGQVGGARMYAFCAAPLPVSCGSICSARRFSETPGGSAGLTVIESVSTSSRNSVAGTPLTVTRTMISPLALNRRTSVVNSAPKLKTPIVLPEPSALSGGHAAAPNALTSVSEASQVGSADVSNLVPCSNCSLILLIALGAPSGAAGSLQVMTVDSPVDVPGCGDR
ncbi:MAG TPA: hypothetical protein VHE14_00165 [Solirubrobacteraceae bacterium]|nr:hypothetical protein [Solirubrobacteraceae bacterium]